MAFVTHCKKCGIQITVRDGSNKCLCYLCRKGYTKKEVKALRREESQKWIKKQLDLIMETERNQK